MYHPYTLLLTSKPPYNHITHSYTNPFRKVLVVYMVWWWIAGKNTKYMHIYIYIIVCGKVHRMALREKKWNDREKMGRCDGIKIHSFS